MKLGKCVNLSNMLEAPNEGQWGRAFEDADITRMTSKGFTGLRLPARFSQHALDTAPYTISPTFLARVKHITDLALAGGMSVIIDMHHYKNEAIFTNPAAEAPRFEAMWRQIAAFYKDYPSNVYFELLNEPNDKLDASNLRSVADPALAAVRESNPNRLVVYPGPRWNGLDAMIAFNFPADPNIVPTLHTYDPANFGFPEASWMNPPSRDDFGTPADIAGIRAQLDKVQTWMQSTGRVPFVGEYGAWEGRPVAEREEFYETVSSAWASIGVQSCAWGYSNTMHLWRDGGWVGNIADKIKTTTTLP